MFLLPLNFCQLTGKQLQVEELTSDVDLQLTEMSMFSARKLHDEVSVRRQAAGTLQVDCSPRSNGARVLTTDGVVPQRRCRDDGRNIRQTDDEVVRPIR